MHRARSRGGRSELTPDPHLNNGEMRRRPACRTRWSSCSSDPICLPRVAIAGAAAPPRAAWSFLPAGEREAAPSVRSFDRWSLSHLTILCYCCGACPLLHAEGDARRRDQDLPRRPRVLAGAHIAIPACTCCAGQMLRVARTTGSQTIAQDLIINFLFRNKFFGLLE